MGVPGGLNTLRPRHNGRHLADDIFKCIFLNENVSISIKFSLKFVPKGQINYISALVQIMAWRRRGDKPLFEPMMISLLTHICVTRPQWVNMKDDQLRRISSLTCKYQVGMTTSRISVFTILTLNKSWTASLKCCRWFFLLIYFDTCNVYI